MPIVALLLLLAQKALPKSRETAPGQESGTTQATEQGDASIFMAGFVPIKIQGQTPIFYNTAKSGNQASPCLSFWMPLLLRFK